MGQTQAPDSFSFSPDRDPQFGVKRWYTLATGPESVHVPSKVFTIYNKADEPEDADSEESTDSRPQENQPHDDTPQEGRRQDGMPQDDRSQKERPRDGPPGDDRSQDERPQGDSRDIYGPFPNKTTFSLAEWYWNSNNKSYRDFHKLVSIIKSNDFSAADVRSVKWNKAFRELGANRADLPNNAGKWITDDGWIVAPVHIDVPFHSQLAGRGTESYQAGKLHYRSIVSVIREVLADPGRASRLHYHPFQATWQPAENYPDVRLYGEIYNLPEFQRVYDEVQSLPPTKENRGLERLVVGLMFSSDGTQLTNFGTAKLWPAYMSFGNESKYERCKPTERSIHQIAYFEFVRRSL